MYPVPFSGQTPHQILASCAPLDAPLQVVRASVLTRVNVLEYLAVLSVLPAHITINPEASASLALLAL